MAEITQQTFNNPPGPSVARPQFEQKLAQLLESFVFRFRATCNMRLSMLKVKLSRCRRLVCAGQFTYYKAPKNSPRSKENCAVDSGGDASSYKFAIRLGLFSQAIEQLRLNGSQSSWIVFIFNTDIPSNKTADQCLNLQYSVINGVLGLDWVLLGERNAADQQPLRKFIRDRGHAVKKLSTNNVQFLRVEDGDLTALGKSMAEDFYGVRENTDITLLAEGCAMPSDWKPLETPATRALLATVRATTGLTDIDFDEDGDIGVRYGTAMTYLRLIGEPQHVHLFSPVLREIEESPKLFARLNEMNARQMPIRFFYRSGGVFAAADVPAEPLIADHLADALARFCAIADGTGPLLQGEFGGQTAFVEFVPSLLKH